MKTKNYIIGIDPGKSGGITALSNNHIADISKMPPNPDELYKHFLFLGLPHMYTGNLSIYIEDVHSMPTDGSRQAFTFGKGLGQIEGVIAAMGLTDALKRVSPMKWMKSFDIKRDKQEENKTQFKNRIKDMASEMSKQKLTLAVCDSYMIAKYGLENQNEIHEEISKSKV